jgi:phosphoribosylanthranilate isomerase
MTKIKICGLTREDDALFCADQGADFLGFIFVPSTPRFVEPERAATIAAKVRERGEQRPKIVGVFRDASSDYIREIGNLVGLDLVQLQGSESNDQARELGLPVVKTLRVGQTLPDTQCCPSADWLLFDTYDERRAGGTGRRFEWSLLAQYERSKPFFLSGGLTPENVVAGISLVRPDAIDLASGVESEPGVKDHDKVARLFERVRRS